MPLSHGHSVGELQICRGGTPASRWAANWSKRATSVMRLVWLRFSVKETPWPAESIALGVTWCGFVKRMPSSSRRQPGSTSWCAFSVAGAGVTVLTPACWLFNFATTIWGLSAKTEDDVASCSCQFGHCHKVPGKEDVLVHI